MKILEKSLEGLASSATIFPPAVIMAWSGYELLASVVMTIGFALTAITLFRIYVDELEIICYEHRNR